MLPPFLVPCSFAVLVGDYEQLEMVAEDKQSVPSYKDDTAFTIVESNQQTMI